MKQIKKITQKSIMALPMSFAVFFSSCAMKECKTYEDKLHGCVEKYDDEYRETPYKNGKKEGIEKSYYEKGRLAAKIPYKNDEINGIIKLYYENGKIAIKASYQNSMLDGLEEYYSEKGKMIAMILYKRGKAISGECKNGKKLDNKFLRKIEALSSDAEAFKEFCGD